MKSMRRIIDELKEMMGISHTKYLAEDLGFSYKTFRNRSTRNSIPFKQILDYCKDKDIDVMKLLYGGVK